MIKEHLTQLSAKKLSFFLLLLTTSFTLFSCKDALDTITSFKINSDATFTVPSTISISSPLIIPTPDIPTNSTQVFENNNTKASLVKEVYLEGLKLTIQSPSDQTFRFLKSIKLYINAEGLDSEVELARLTDIDNNVGNSIDLVTSKADLKEFIKKDKFSLRTEVLTDEAVLTDITIKANMTFNVKAGLK